MKVKKLISPEFRVTIGDYVLNNGFTNECFSSRAGHSDWSRIELDSMFHSVIKINDMTEAKIELGYEEDFDTLLEGYVRLDKKDYWKEIIVKDDMIKLEKVLIKATFIDCEPQDVIKYSLGAAGIENIKLSEAVYEKKKVFSIANKNVVDTIKEVNSSWNISNDFFFQDKCFYWGMSKEQSDIYTLLEGESILNIQKYNELWEVETLGIPWIHHSQKVVIDHSKYTGSVTIEKTIIRSDRNGFVRMYLYFKGGNEIG